MTTFPYKHFLNLGRDHSVFVNSKRVRGASILHNSVSTIVSATMLKFVHIFVKGGCTNNGNLAVMQKLDAHCALFELNKSKASAASILKG